MPPKAGHGKQPKKRCEYCGELRNANYLRQHIERRHGNAKKTSTALVPVNNKPRIVKPALASFTILPFIVIEGNDGSIWHAERVR